MSGLSNRQILVGRFPAGLRGLDELFEQLYEQGREPDEAGLGEELLQGARAHNYIAPGSADEFVQALLREYRKYVAAARDGRRPAPVRYGTWRGYPREQIPWFPTVALDLCNGCGACLELCPSGVFELGPDGEVMVVEPFRCEVGCSSCTKVCVPKAITFPPRAILDAFRPGAR